MYKDREKQREYAREWVAARRRKYFEGKSCVQCGSAEDLELDHIDPATKVSHSIWSWSEVRRNAELLKCQPLCNSCHRTKSNKELASKALCGTRARYLTGCKCERCKAANAAYKRQLQTRHLTTT